MKSKILFLIHDLGPGGAEKVLVNLVNNMDPSKFNITVMTLFDVGENKQFLHSNIKYKYWKKKMIRGNSHLMKLFSPQKLHRMIVKDHYDIEVAYLEGPTARVISGCEDLTTKKIVWIHREQKSTDMAVSSFRSRQEAEYCYNSFDRIICVSETVVEDFKRVLDIHVPVQVLFNTNESEQIKKLSSESVTDSDISEKSSQIKLIGVGKLIKNKGFDRLIRIVGKLRQAGLDPHLYILGTGPEEDNLRRQVQELKLDGYVTLLGYQLNPYKYIAKADLFVCASMAEGFSTAATESLILGIPVCTVEVSGMKEMLGANNEFGIVTENTDDALYQGLLDLMSDPSKLNFYKAQANIRGSSFITEETVAAVQKMLEEL